MTSPKKPVPRVNTIKTVTDGNVGIKDLADIMISRVLTAPGVRPESYWRRRSDALPAYVEAIDLQRDRVIYRRSRDDEDDARVLSRKMFLQTYAPVPS